MRESYIYNPTSVVSTVHLSRVGQSDKELSRPNMSLHFTTPNLLGVEVFTKLNRVSYILTCLLPSLIVNNSQKLSVLETVHQIHEIN